MVLFADFCVYKSVPLREGDIFDDGCDLVCRCEDSMTNSVVCDDRWVNLSLIVSLLQSQGTILLKQLCKM